MNIFLTNGKCKFCGKEIKFAPSFEKLDHETVEHYRSSRITRHTWKEHVIPFIAHKKIGYLYMNNEISIDGAKQVYSDIDYRGLVNFLEELMENYPDFPNFTIAQVLK